MADAAATVYVVDDDPAVRDSLQFLIESMGLPVRTFAGAAEFLDACNGTVRGCLVADLRLPGMSGLDMCDEMVQRGYELATIVITGHGDVPQAVRAMKSGAIDFIEKPFSDQVLLNRINEALKIDEQNRSLADHRAEVRARYETLTAREREVMTAVIEGKLNKQIASDLGLSHKTIEVHRAHVMSKMKARSLASLVKMAVALDLTEPQVAAR